MSNWKNGSKETTRLAISGMTCQGCVRAVREAVSQVPQVAHARVDLEEQRLEVDWAGEAGADGEKALVQAVEGAGYGARVWKAEGQPGAGPGRRCWRGFLEGWAMTLWLGIPVTAFLMVCEWGLGAAGTDWYRWVAFILATPVQVFGGARFYQGAWRQLKHWGSNMDTLVSLGSTTAYLFSVWVLVAGWDQHVYFMESAAIITLISIGHWMEGRVSQRAADALKGLLNLAPERTRLIRNGQEEWVAVAEVTPGAHVVIRPGDRIPVDGRVVSGDSLVDESMLTGESIPVAKGPDLQVYAGTANQSGKLEIEVTQLGSETALGRIIEMVERAQNSRANIQRLADRVSSVFVPIVILIALATGIWWAAAPGSAMAVAAALEPWLWEPHGPSERWAAAVYHVAAVLIIACPCAMGLATPIAIMAGANRASQRGILIRDGSALEKSGRITDVVFDKTGTLTEGRMAVAAVEIIEGQDESQVKSLVQAMAEHSKHPVSRALAGDGSIPNMISADLSDWREVRGSGTEAMHSGAAIRLGSLDWLDQTGIAGWNERPFSRHWREQGSTVLGMTRNQELLALVAVRDRIKPHAAEVVRDLQGRGLRVWLMTGDHEVTGRALAREVGIPLDCVLAQARPETKADRVEELQREGRRVAFVGDGINDAPALERSDLGVAVMEASDVARDAADIILLRRDIEAIPEAILLARSTLRTIWQNLFWAFFYNTAAIPLAVLGFFSPIVSALAMGLSDLVVIGNALRLRHTKTK